MIIIVDVRKTCVWLTVSIVLIWSFWENAWWHWLDLKSNLLDDLASFTGCFMQKSGWMFVVILLFNKCSKFSKQQWAWGQEKLPGSYYSLRWKLYHIKGCITFRFHCYLLTFIRFPTFIILILPFLGISAFNTSAPHYLIA